MKLLKSKKGFTLIELLVVIGILAVLAAIAIPSVAGLIDRANASADKTNANEMTNAIERFASEYEIVRQDLMSGLIKDVNNLDGAQGRVYYVTKVTTQSQIENLEKDATAGPETTGRAIYRDTKYPVNVETTKSIIEAYTKTSSATFVPKQSDKHYYYSPDCGLVVVGDKNVTDPAKLNELVVSGMDAKGNKLSGSTRWIDLTTATSSSVAVVGSAVFYDKVLSWDELKLPEHGEYHEYAHSQITDDAIKDGAFYYCNDLNAIEIPSTVTIIGSGAFQDCGSLASVNIPPSVNTIGASAFWGCSELESITLPNGIDCISDNLFMYCSSLKNVVLPSSVTEIGDCAFMYCNSLTSIAIPDKVVSIGSEAFAECSELTQIAIPNSMTTIKDSAFWNCDNLSSIVFGGTKAQWNNIEKIRYWNYGCQEITVTCTDGTVIIPAA